jgi:hypothetical protein
MRNKASVMEIATPRQRVIRGCARCGAGIKARAKFCKPCSHDHQVEQQRARAMEARRLGRLEAGR